LVGFVWESWSKIRISIPVKNSEFLTTFHALSKKKKKQQYRKVNPANKIK